MENKKLKTIGACGLYCGACRKYQSGKCPGCHDNENVSWCDIRKCCIERNITSCADCTDFSDLKACRKFNNFMGKVMGVLLNSNRFACIYRIREIGHEAFAAEMDEKGLQTLKRR
ncbi:MAG: DUF3795 domain-containing protein [Cytophagaceae bacterium]|jgi:hypothetical protein|nr:DUF3795 domain-containing protein [Cytophagaceae bacterium]